MTEGAPFDEGLNWSPEEYLIVEFGDGSNSLHLTWENTTVYKYRIGDGRYDHFEHHIEQGETVFYFLDGEGMEDLREKFDTFGYPTQISPIVESDIVGFREELDVERRMDQDTARFAVALHNVQGPEDFLRLPVVGDEGLEPPTPSV